jgi:HD-like signal output (HDOD) protein
METASCARALAKSESGSDKLIEDAFLGGMLHDVGRLVLAGNMPEKCREVAKVVDDEEISLRSAERNVLQATHGEVGAYVMGLWGLPDSIVEAIAYHECPSESPSREMSALTLVHCADALTLQIENSVQGEDAGLDMKYLEELGLTQRLESWKGVCEEALLAEAAE